MHFLIGSNRSPYPTAPMTTPDPEPSEPPTLRILRFAALAVLALAAALLLAIEIVAISPPLHGFIVALMGFPFNESSLRNAKEWLVAGILITPILLLAAALFVAAWRLRFATWRAMAVGTAAILGILAYLAHDDPVLTQPVPIMDASLAPASARESFALLMTYGKQQPLAKNFREPPFKNPYPDWNNRDPAKWRAMLTLHRAELEAHWAALAPERAWWDGLDAYERIGDLTPPSADSDIISFQVMRTLSHQAIAIASLQAIDGHGDQAIDTLLPTLRVAIKLQPESRTLVRTMISVVIERFALETAGFVLDTTPVSPEARARLADAIRGGDPEAGARRLMTVDYAFALNAIMKERAGDFVQSYTYSGRRAWLRAPLNAASPFLYNPRATFNTYGALVADLQDFAGRRELGKITPRMTRFLQEDTRPRFKNLLGDLLLPAIVPAIQKVAENYWRTQDLRTALLARLGAK